MSFAEILQSVRPGNVRRLKDRAFLANQLAKLTSGPSQRAAYAVKDRTIGQLFKIDAANVNSVKLWPELQVGVTFQYKGRLHLKLWGLSPEALDIVVSQLEAYLVWEELAALLRCTSEETTETATHAR